MIEIAFNRRRLASRVLAIATTAIAGVALLSLSSCNHSENKPEPPAPSQPAASNGGDVVTHYLAANQARDSVIKMRVKIVDSGPATELGMPSDVELALYSKRPQAGGRMLLIEFLSPAQQRDRDSLITISPQEEVEGVRYVQSNDSFLTTKGVTSEDSLFGMTAQEIADGQPEKYDFKLVGEGTTGKWQTYKLGGSLKRGAESKFQRVVLNVAKDSYAAVAAEFYDSHNELARRITVDDLSQQNGHWTRMRWTLENPVRGKRLEFQTIDAKYDQSLNDSIFTRDNLKKLARK